MNNQRVLFFKTIKENDLIIIRGYYYLDPEYFVQVIIKQSDILKVISFIKNIKHDPEVDIKGNPNENVLNLTLEKFKEPDYQVLIRVRKYNYSFENSEVRLCSYWEKENIQSNSIDIPYKNYEDLRMQLDSLIAEIEKVL